MLSADPLDHPLQGPWLALLRHALSVPAGTAGWIALSLGGHLPVQAYIILEFCTFWNGLLAQLHGNGLLRAALAAQCVLVSVRDSQDCWLAQWARVLSGPAVGVEDFSPHLLAMTPLPMAAASGAGTVRQAMLDEYTCIIRRYQSPFLPTTECAGRRIAMHFHSFNLAPGMGCRPPHVTWNVPTAARKSWLNFLAANAPVPVRRVAYVDGRPEVAYALRRCDRCLTGAVGDECHVLLRCGATMHVRREFNAVLSFGDSTVQSFLLANKHTKQSAMFVWRALSAFKAARKWPPAAAPPNRPPDSLEGLEDLLLHICR
jgi:hypothetical protein